MFEVKISLLSIANISVNSDSYNEWGAYNLSEYVTIIEIVIWNEFCENAKSVSQNIIN